MICVTEKVKSGAERSRCVLMFALTLSLNRRPGASGFWEFRRLLRLTGSPGTGVVPVPMIFLPKSYDVVTYLLKTRWDKVFEANRGRLVSCFRLEKVEQYKKMMTTDVSVVSALVHGIRLILSCARCRRLHDARLSFTRPFAIGSPFIT